MKAVQNQIAAWYDRNKRNLPWRVSQDPYRVWISEIMLQQTTVAVVIPYYEKFLKEFPTVRDLAAADEDRVLSLWSGLGYYSRARNLHAAAKEIAAMGAFPSTYEDLLKLPGVGPYTAAAVASIAFDEEVAAIDGNVVRVISRLFDIDTDVGAKTTQKKISKFAHALIAGQVPSLHNQAMMELGATVCLPQNPACLLCPAVKVCKSWSSGTVDARPVKKKNRKQDPWLWEMYVVDGSKRVALTKNNGTPWLKNTWVLPGSAKPLSTKALPAHDFKHSITHHKIFVQVKKTNSKVILKKFNANELKWVNREEIEKYGVSSIVQKALRFAFGTFSTVLLLLGVGCKTAPQGTSASVAGAPPTSSVPVPVPKDYTLPVAVQITHEGENSEGRFSPDGQRIIFQSKNRSKHSNSQIYVYSVKSQKDRRVTYNDGEDTGPDFNKGGTRILYASTTDEEKEHPDPLSSPPPVPAELPVILGKLPDCEVYISEPDGSHISRLTQVPGFDGEAKFSPDDRHIVYTSGRTGDYDLFEMNLYGEDQRRMSSAKGYNGQGAYSPDGKTIALAASHGDEKVMEIFVMDRWGIKPKALTTKAAIHWNPTWSPDGKKILFSSNRDDEKNFELYSVNPDGTCLKRLTYASGWDLYPDVSADGTKVLFTSNRSGVNQLYVMDYVESKDCLPEAP